MKHKLSFVISALLWSSSALVAASSTEANSVWKMDSLQSVGGIKPTVVGTPHIVDGASFFNGVSDGIINPSNPLKGLKAFTVEVLIKPDADGQEEQRFIHLQDSAEHRLMIEIRLTKEGQWALDSFLKGDDTAGLTLLNRTLLHPAGKWTWVAVRYDGKTLSNWINGKKELEGPVTAVPMSDGNVGVGFRMNKVYWYKGGIKELRFYATPLDSSDLQRAP